MRDENYINIQGWMINRLGLKGNELLLYAIIYGFSQDGQSEYYGSLRYVSEALSISRPTAIKIIRDLLKKRLIIRTKESHYKIGVVKKLYQGGKETLPLGGKETLPNNNNTNNNNNNGDFLKKSQSEISFQKVEDNIETRREFMERKKLPYTPRKQTPKQRNSFEELRKSQKVIDYFKSKGKEIHGMDFLKGDVGRNKRVVKQIKDVINRLENYKEFIDWWFYEDNDWCTYEPEQAFSYKIIERFKNTKSQPKLLKL